MCRERYMCSATLALVKPSATTAATRFSVAVRLAHPHHGWSRRRQRSGIDKSSSRSRTLFGGTTGTGLTERGERELVLSLRSRAIALREDCASVLMCRSLRQRVTVLVGRLEQQANAPFEQTASVTCRGIECGKSEVLGCRALDREHDLLRREPDRRLRERYGPGWARQREG